LKGTNRIKKVVFRSFLFLLMALSIAAAILYYLVFLSPENHKSAPYEIATTEFKELQEGDIVLRQGYGYFSRAIAKYQEAEYPVTHCGMLVEEGNGFAVIHALSSSFSDFDGVQKQSLRRFLNESVPNTLMVVRFKGDTTIQQALVTQANTFLAQEIPFDHEFDRHDSTKMYCTELFRNIFLATLDEDIFQFQLDRTNSDYYDVTTFLDTVFFQRIINHHSPNQLK
jgi:hypothetical protein